MKLPSRAVSLLVLGSITSGCPLRPPTYAVTATLANSEDVPQTEALSISYTGAARTTTRLVAAEAVHSRGAALAD